MQQQFGRCLGPYAAGMRLALVMPVLHLGSCLRCATLLVPLATCLCSFVRRIGYVPLLAWGWLGTVVPHRVGGPACCPCTMHPSCHPACTAPPCLLAPRRRPAEPGLAHRCPLAQVPMHVVVGKPIPVERNAAPNSKEVQRTLQRYIQELCRIFEQYKAAAGHPHATLTIV